MTNSCAICTGPASPNNQFYTHKFAEGSVIRSVSKLLSDSIGCLHRRGRGASDKYCPPGGPKIRVGQFHNP